jgi:cell division protein FtsB
MTALYLAVLSGQRALDGYQARQQVVVAVREIETLRLKNLGLQAELNAALADAEIERAARDELGLVRPGDHPVVLVWPSGGPPTPRTMTPTAEARPQGWRAWVNLFFD